MSIVFTAASHAVYAASSVLDRSLHRGDFDNDPDFAAAAATVVRRMRSAVDDADDMGEDDATVIVPAEGLDEVLAVLESDVRASSELAPALAAANEALASAR